MSHAAGLFSLQNTLASSKFRNKRVKIYMCWHLKVCEQKDNLFAIMHKDFFL